MKIFQADTKIFAGIDTEKVLEKISCKKYIFMTDPMMVKIGISKKIEEIFQRKGIEYEVFSEIEVNPSLESIKKALEKVIDFAPEKILALGGGSTLDSAKAVSYFMNKSGKDIPVIAIPTTCGTGSEVTSYAVITDTVNNIKIPIKDDKMVPEIAILDPEFTKTLPKSVVADGGIDALTHAIEAYTSKGANLYTQIYALYAIKTIFKNLIKMYEDISNREARVEMGKASCIAGFSFEKAGLGINHSIAHNIGGKFHKAHGRSNGVVLPYVLRFNSTDGETAKRYCEIAKELELPSSSIEEGARSLAIAIEILNKKLGIQSCVKELGIPEDEYKKLIPEMAEVAMKDICTSGNIKKVTIEDMKKIFEILY